MPIILLWHRYNNLLLNGQHFVAANYKYLKKRYLNFPAAKNSSLVGTGGMRCFTLATALNGCVSHPRPLPGLRTPRGPPGWGSADRSQHLPRRPFQTGWLSHQGIRIQHTVPCPNNRAVLTKETQTRSLPVIKLPFFPEHKWRTP